jgi:hypothetical protein
VAGLDLLVGPAEDHGVAALEAHHVLAGTGQRHHQGIDLLLLAGGAVAGLADQHLFRLAAGEIEDVRRHQIVEQDHVGGMQGPHRA